MKRFLFLLAAPLALTACNQQASTTTSGEANTGTQTSSSQIERSEEVPDGVETIGGLTVPRGFEIQVYAENLVGPRRLAIAPGGTAKSYDVFVSESPANRVTVLRDKDGNGISDSSTAFVGDLNQPYGLAFYKNWLYIANTDAVVRVPYTSGATSTKGKPQKLVDLTKGGYNQHWTRNLLFSRDNKQLFVTVGSSCNTCEEDDSQRAAVSVMTPEGKDKRVYASGLRNPVGMAWQPGTDQLWTVVNERDNVGDDVPPDYLTSVKDGKFYGWPYAYTDIGGQVQSDPTFGEGSQDKIRATVPADVPVQAHSAALGLAFYPTENAKYPAEYQGDAFLAFHGSWNRSEKTGYKIARVNFENGKAVGISDFVSGFLTSDGKVTGRPVDIIAAPDGSLLFSDDGAGKIYRVYYKG